MNTTPVKAPKSHIPAPMTVRSSPAPQKREDAREHPDSKPPATLVEDKRWELPCTD